MEVAVTRAERNLAKIFAVFESNIRKQCYRLRGIMPGDDVRQECYIKINACVEKYKAEDGDWAKYVGRALMNLGSSLLRRHQAASRHVHQHRTTGEKVFLSLSDGFPPQREVELAIDASLIVGFRGKVFDQREVEYYLDALEGVPVCETSQRIGASHMEEFRCRRRLRNKIGELIGFHPVFRSTSQKESDGDSHLGVENSSTISPEN